MISFDFLDFLEFFGPQTVFIGGRGTKFKILSFFSNFLDLKQLENNQICIQMVKFIFK
jgi:hypothetical protein